MPVAVRNIRFGPASPSAGGTAQAISSIGAAVRKNFVAFVVQQPIRSSAIYEKMC
jgi:hypothetical protein